MIMRKLLAVFVKEWTLLYRDKIGLLFLFILPMCLVLFITLTSSEEHVSNRSLNILLLNNDYDKDKYGEIGKEVIKAFRKIDGFKLTTTIKNKSSKIAVSKGKYQALIILPENLTTKTFSILHRSLQTQNYQFKPPILKLSFDPALAKNSQDQITTVVQLIMTNLEAKLWRTLAIKDTHQKSNSKPQDLFVVDALASKEKNANDVQQNVPAWALFGMFFIITPLSGIIIKERKLGVVGRLSLAPIHFSCLIWGKILAFVVINILQLILMLAVGVFILPWFGLIALNVTSQPLAILIIGLAASFAATGFGMLIGSLVRTPEQANVVGPFIIVIAAAIGGIFVPVYFLPEALKHISNLSPMQWALQAFIDIFVRDANVYQLLPNIGKLLSFAAVTISLASIILSRIKR